MLVFGTKKLRNAGGDLGSAVKNFKDAMNEGEASASKKPDAVASSQAQSSQQHESKKDQV